MQTHGAHDMDKNQSLTRDEAAAFLKISVHQLRRMAAENRGPKFRKHGTARGAAVRYRVADLLAWQDNPDLTVGCARPANMPNYPRPCGIVLQKTTVTTTAVRPPRLHKYPATISRKPKTRGRSK